jgi:hypothetical protein
MEKTTLIEIAAGSALFLGLLAFGLIKTLLTTKE